MSLVLVVDDEAAVLEVLSEVVEDLGHVVVRARDGREALNLALARKPDLVVTDHLMPMLSGTDLCRELRKVEKLKKVPVILLSASPPKAVLEGCIFLSKPFELVDFEAMVKKLLDDL